MKTTPYLFGLSPCPNDSFISYGFVTGKTQFPCIINTYIRDVQELNEQVLKGHLPMSKISAAVYPKIEKDYMILQSGAALGRGCGPLVVARTSYEDKPIEQRVVAIPGSLTTANALWMLYTQANGILAKTQRYMQFDAIIPALQEGSVDIGVLIHESRFEYAQYGLTLVADLGVFWEARYTVPIPLGVMVLHRALAPLKCEIESAIQASLQYAHEHYEEAIAYCKTLAQELQESVLQQHIAMFVNEYTNFLDTEGMAALAVLCNTLKIIG